MTITTLERVVIFLAAIIYLGVTIVQSGFLTYVPANLEQVVLIVGIGLAIATDKPSNTL
jgi:hypothetical protein